MRKILVFFASLVTVMACSDSNSAAFDGVQEHGALTTPLKWRTITMSASVGEDQRTTLADNVVLWDKDDAYCVMNEAEAVSKTLQIVVDGPSQALGLKVGRNDKNVLLKYEKINVNIGGEDVTNAILSPADEANLAGDNDYKIGIQNTADGKRFPEPGTPINAPVKSKYQTWPPQTNYGVSLVRATSSSDVFSASHRAVVTMTDIEYSTNNGTSWNAVNQNSELFNGSQYYGDLKDVAHYEWLGNLNWRMTLSDEAGCAHGVFEGVTTNADVPNDKTRAVYPYDAFKAYANGLMTIEIPERQTYVENSFDHKANIMVGKVTVVEEGEDYGRYDAHFKNVMGVLQLTLTGDDYYLSELLLTDRSGASLWGTASLAADSQDGITTSSIAGGGATVVMDCGGVKLTSEPTTFNIVVPVGAFAGGFDVEIRTQDGRSKTFGTSRDNTIARNDLKRMPTMSITGLPLAEFDIENAAVKAYMGQSGTPAFSQKSLIGTAGNSKTLVTRTITDNTSLIGQDRPKTFDIVWKATTPDYNISFYDKTADRYVFQNRKVTENAYSFANMTPGHEYSYRVVDGTGREVSGGAFRVVGQVRMVTIDDSWNDRDLGGWTSTLGGQVKYGWVYRGASLNGTWTKGVGTNFTRIESAKAENYTFSDLSRNQIRDLGLRAELDLRGVLSEESSIVQNSKESPHPLSVGNNTGLPADYWTFNRISSSGGMNNPTSNSAIVQDVAWIIDQVMDYKHPVIYHCKSGADRTGCVSMLVLSLLGVAPGDVVRDYELTTFSREYVVLEGRNAFRAKPANEISRDYNFFTEGFTTFGSSQGVNWQEKAYYYLNQTFRSQGVYIPASKLDAFIKFMLDIDNYQHPSFANE